jgi:hypothetical protein
MSSIPLQIVLLIAVVISQILGGNSCCCLERAIFSALADDGSQATEAFRNSEASPSPQQSQKWNCPKCSVRKASPAIPDLGAQKLQCRLPQFGEDVECRCIKLSNNANTPSGPFSLKLDLPTWSNQVHLARHKREVVSLVFRKYEVPIRFGGHSWLSIACIWKN